MRRLARWVFRLVLALIVLGVVGAVAVILLLDTFTKEILINRLRSATGMEAKISAVHVGLLSPTVSIEGLKLYNTAEFGGSVCLDLPELDIEYDPSALRARQLHLILLRLTLAELSMVQDKTGRKNFALAQVKNNDLASRAKTSVKWKFVGIDVLNATFGKFHTSNLASGRRDEMDFTVKNQILRNVKTWGDLAPLGLTRLTQGNGETNVDLSQLIDNLLKLP